MVGATHPTLAETDQAITRYAAAAKQAALAGDDAELDRAEASLPAQDRSATLKAALTEVEQQLQALERTKAEIADRKVRAQTAAEIELVVRNMADAANEFDAAAARLSEYTTRAVPWLWEVRGLDEFVTIARAQVPPAVDLVGKMLRAHADAGIAGKAPATLPRPEGPLPNEQRQQLKADATGSQRIA
jgi:chromosome segregation ATPase